MVMPFRDRYCSYLILAAPFRQRYSVLVPNRSGAIGERDTTVLESLLILLGLLGIVISVAVKLLCLPSKTDHRQHRRQR